MAPSSIVLLFHRHTPHSLMLSKSPIPLALASNVGSEATIRVAATLLQPVYCCPDILRNK